MKLSDIFEASKPKIVCRGYGSPHGYAQGRHWFVCSKCRWSVNKPEPKKPVKEAIEVTEPPKQKATADKAQYVANYVNAFEPDGRVAPNVLPWDTSQDFYTAMKTVQKMPRAFFMNHVNVPTHVWDHLRDHYVSFLKTTDGVYIIHDDKTDDHYFFI